MREEGARRKEGRGRWRDGGFWGERAQEKREREEKGGIKREKGRGERWEGWEGRVRELTKEKETVCTHAPVTYTLFDCPLVLFS